MPWIRTWAIALAAVAGVAGLWELVIRDAGLGPQFADNRQLWADTRHRLNDDGATAIALLGASRHQRAIDVDLMSRLTGRPVYQLSLEGTSALGTLEDLAVDPRFRGTVVYSIAPAFSFNRQLSKLDGGKQSQWIQYYRGQSFVERAEQRLRLLLQGMLAFRSPDATLPRILTGLATNGRLPTPNYVKMYRNRSVDVDYSLLNARVDHAAIVALYRQNAEPYSDAEFQTIIDYFATLAGLLQQKGARLIVIRLPSDGEVLQIERQMFPKTSFWSALERQVPATFVHFEDHPQLSGFLGGDGSHVDSSQSGAFTARLIEVLVQRELL